MSEVIDAADRFNKKREADRLSDDEYSSARRRHPASIGEPGDDLLPEEGGFLNDYNVKPIGGIAIEVYSVPIEDVFYKGDKPPDDAA